MVINFSYFGEFINVPYRWSEEDLKILERNLALLPECIEQFQEEYFPRLSTTEIRAKLIEIKEIEKKAI